MKKDKELYEKAYEKPGAIWTRTEPHPELINLIENGKIKSCKVIDIGCGEGYQSIYLASKGFNVTGIDLSERAIQYAKENVASRGVNVRFMAMDIVDLEQLKEKFDFALEWGLLESIPFQQRQRYIENVAKLLNKSGKYLSMSFNEQSPEFGGSGKRVREGPLGAKIYYSSQSELRKLFEPHFHMIEAKLVKVHGVKGPGHLWNYFFMEKVNKK